MVSTLTTTWMSRKTLNGNKRFTTKVKLPNGMTAIETGGTKKSSKHNAAWAMLLLDILEGRTSAVAEEVSQSITAGWETLRGGEVGGYGRRYN